VTTRTYRVQVAGQFATLTPTIRAQLRVEQADHDVFASALARAVVIARTCRVLR
jgi:hypothetical protein